MKHIKKHHSERTITFNYDGYEYVYTYTAEAGDTSWDRPKRRRDVATINLFGEQRKYPNEKKQRWVKKLN